MQQKSFIILLFILALLSVSVHAVDIESDDIAVYSNASVYLNPAFDSVALVEFPFTLNRNNFEFIKGDTVYDGYYGRIIASVKLLNVNGIPIDSTQTIFTIKTATRAETQQADIRLFNKLSLLVKPGIYSAHITILDVVSKKKGDFFIDKILVGKSSQKNGINMSGLNSAFSAEYVGDDSTKINPLIYKNGYNLLINPVSAFTNSDKLIYIYGEIYNLEYNDESRTKYQLIVNALDKDNNIYQMYGSRLSKKPGSSAVFVEKIDIAGWHNGVYSLEVIAVDLATQVADTSYLPISIVSPQEVVLAAQNISNTADPYNNLTMKQKIQLVRYLLTMEQERTLNNLGDKGKENFLKAIWAEHDPTPSSRQNEFREDLIYRFHYSNNSFSTNEFKSDGWNTDRGRIFMQYGMWEERDDNEAPRTERAFEVWYYHSIKGGGATFIFEDYYGDDRYPLVHSSVSGEVYSKKWAEYIITGFLEVLDQ